MLTLPYWKASKGTDYAADFQVIQDTLNDGTYNQAEAAAARAKALCDDFDTQQLEPRLVYQLPTTYTRAVQLVDDRDATQQVALRLSYFVDMNQTEDLDFSRSLLPRYYPHLTAVLVRPLVLRPYVHLGAADVVAFD